MTTSRIDSVTDFAIESDESAVEVEFVDVHSGNNFLEHPESDEEVGSIFCQTQVIVKQAKKGKAKMMKN